MNPLLAIVPVTAPLAAHDISGQESVAGLIVGLTFVGFAVYVLVTLRRKDPGEPVGSELELSPNRRPYFDDDALEGPRLDRALLVCFALLAFIAVALPLYWIREPGREVNANTGFNIRAVNRGAGLFQSTKAPTTPDSPIHFGCADCHGSAGQGGSTTFVVSNPATPNVPPIQVSWSAPPLNTVAYRFTDDEILQILTYGRAGTPMPAWGTAGGGPMDAQQLSDLVAYIHSIQLTKAQAITFWQQRAQATAIGEGSVDANGNAVITGKVLFDTNCARCHTQGYSYGAPGVSGGGGQYAPNLTNGSEIRQFPNMADQVAFVTQGVDPGKGYGTGGIGTDYGGGMPHFGEYLSQQEITEIVQYERSL